MLSGSKAVLSFPATPAPPRTPEQREVAQTQNQVIAETCEQTSGALQELRHGVIHVLLDTLKRCDLDNLALVQVLDERPSVVEDLRNGETDALATERLIDYLERLRPVLHS